MKFRTLYGGGEQLRVIATGAHAPGDIVVYGGLVAVYTGLAPCASGDVINVTLNAVGEAVTPSGTTFSAGALVYWDTVNQYCVTGSGSNIIKLGTAVLAKTSGQLVTQVIMNRLPM